MIMLTGDQIPRARLLVLRSSLKLEIVGLKKRGRSAYSIVKEEFGLKGNKQKVLDQYNEILEGMGLL